MSMQDSSRKGHGPEMIDRESLVKRHNPCFTEWNAQSPLTVGNGDFAFTADFTGLQTCTGDVDGSVPRCTMSQTGFHKYSDAPESYEGYRMKEYQCGERTVGYMTDPEGQQELFDGLRVNPHRFHMGRIGLYIKGTSEQYGAEGGIPSGLLLDEISGLEQTLDLWTGVLSSRFSFRGAGISIQTVCHPSLPMISLRIESSLVCDGTLGLDLHFPYGSHDISGADWSRDGAHSSELSESGDRGFLVERRMDDCSYTTALCFGGESAAGKAGPHRWFFYGDSEVLECSILFSPSGSAGDECTELPSFSAVMALSSDHWTQFWMDGAAVSFEGSSDPGAMELERRVVLSQYLLAIQSMGSLPPAETGLTCNSWYGKFHLEMHPWHSLQGLLWGRAPLVRQSLPWYRRVLEGARKRAESQGYKGVRWPKMTDPSGNDSPSPIGCLLC